ncbi:MAG: HAMP domain-containing histidine kinase [Clostridia bacterium]|nr:HAMP domain-containing histidine kinase [Clostridia bacterium]
MTLRKLWLLVLFFIAVLSISINSLILNTLTDKYFSDYRSGEYENHIDEILDFSKSALLAEELSVEQMAVALETHLDDPIIQIKLYDQNGNIIVDVRKEIHDMMSGGMMGMMWSDYDEADSEVDSFKLTNDGVVIGQLNITRYSSLEDSIVARKFKSSLLVNSLYSIAIVTIIAIIIGAIVSRRMSRDLTNTAQIANDISMGGDAAGTDSKIIEIRTIQQSLLGLNDKLKLKNKSRKVLIDELVHQTRTPLTVLKTHLEGLSDNIIKLTPEEIKVCENQIENITAIISNMSSMIDAEKGSTEVSIDEFEISSLLKQIAGGLQTQFENKGITLEYKAGRKIVLNTDKFKLSQAVYNILTNAYKFTQANGTVKMSYGCTDQSLQIIIKDNGAGIRKDDLHKIFDAYYSSEKNNSKIEGLGLFIAMENIKLIHGTIDVSSDPGMGSEFTINIPINITGFPV